MPAGATAPVGDASTGLTVGVSVLVLVVLATMGWFLLGTSSDPDQRTEGRSADGREQAGGSTSDGIADRPPIGGSDRQTSDSLVCADLDPMAWNPSETTTELIAATRSGSVPSPAPGGPAIGPARFSAEYPSAEDFLAQSTVPDPAARAQVMADADYAGGIENEYDFEAGLVKVQVLAFREEHGVARYLTARLADICPVMGDAQVLPLGDDGFAFVDDRDAVHGHFILGTYQVSLMMCDCATGTETVQQWYARWVEQYGMDAGEASDVPSTTDGPMGR